MKIRLKPALDTYGLMNCNRIDNKQIIKINIPLRDKRLSSIVFHFRGIKIGLIDYVIKIVGGAVTFGLIAIALRRRFERKCTH